MPEHSLTFIKDEQLTNNLSPFHSYCLHSCCSRLNYQHIHTRALMPFFFYRINEKKDNQVCFLNFLETAQGNLPLLCVQNLVSSKKKEDEKKQLFRTLSKTALLTGRSNTSRSWSCCNCFLSWNFKENCQNWSYEVFPLKAALYMSNVSQELKQKCTFYFCEVNLYVFVFCFFSRGSWIKIVGGFLGICLGKWNYKWFIVQLSLSLSNGIKFNLDEK